MHRTAEFLAGVIEGFYGPTWRLEERFQLLDWMRNWGLNTYLYAPKDDLRLRAAWREAYPTSEIKSLQVLLRQCLKRRIRFVYGLSPGLDIHYTRPADLRQLQKRFEQILSLKCENFALLFDDIPEKMRATDAQRFGSLALAQAYIANSLFRWLRQISPKARLLFCPTAYCGRMVAQNLGGEDYLPILGRALLPEIEVLWTGPEIISSQITVAHARELAGVLRRKPLIWDNLHANDYDGRRFFCGPYAGRPPELRNEVAGILLNPNNEFSLNFVPLMTLAAFVRCGRKWKPRQSYEQAMRSWLPKFVLCNSSVKLRDLILFCDCYYHPHQDGPEAQKLYRQAEAALAATAEGRSVTAAFLKRSKQLREFCGRLANLRDRSLFAALSRRIWELREELDLLEHFVGWLGTKTGANGAFHSDFHLPQTYRGGFVAHLQALLVQHANGTFTPSQINSKPPRRNNSHRVTQSLT